MFQIVYLNIKTIKNSFKLLITLYKLYKLYNITTLYNNASVCYNYKELKSLNANQAFYLILNNKSIDSMNSSSSIYTRTIRRKWLSLHENASQEIFDTNYTAQGIVDSPETFELHINFDS